MKEGLLFILSGPSGAGKGTICREILKRNNAEISVSMTTREKREGEIEGKHYYFVSEDEFKEKIENDALLEYACVYGNYYATPREPVMEKLCKGIDVILEIDIQGALKVKEACPEGIFIFILPPSMSELRKRIIGRGSETEDSIKCRMEESLKEISYIDKYDYCVVNGVLEEAADRVAAIMVAEHSRVREEIYEQIKGYEEEK